MDTQFKQIKIEELEAQVGKLVNGDILLGKFKTSGGEEKDLKVPIFILQGEKPGPTAVLLGGLAGTDTVSISICYDLLEQFNPKNLAGTIIFLPIINAPGYFSGSKNHPYDGKSIEDTFPGQTDGSISEQTAASVFKVIVENADVVVRIKDEPGDITTNVYAQISGSAAVINNNETTFQKTLSTGLEIITLEQPVEGMLGVELAQKGNIPLITLVAGGNDADAERKASAQVNSALQNLLASYEMLELNPEMPKKQYVLKQINAFYSSFYGNLRLKQSLGDYVRKGELIAEILNPETADKVQVKADISGYLFQLNPNLKITQGEKVFAILNLKEDVVSGTPGLEKDALKVVEN